MGGSDGGKSLDHRPILLFMNQTRERGWKVRKVFRYEAKWALEEDCEKVMKGVWQKEKEGRELFHKLQSLLENCRGVVVRWSKQLGVERGKEIKEETILKIVTIRRWQLQLRGRGVKKIDDLVNWIGLDWT